MTPKTVGLERLWQQHLTHAPCATPAGVVGWLGAVQAQDYLGTQWALGMRMGNTTADVIERAFNEGSILRTHVMRPTWHFTTPDDIRWLLELTAPRVHAVNAYMYRQLEIDDALSRRANAIIATALHGGKQRTRAELGVALAEGGIMADGMRLGYIIHHAELDAIVCSGGRRGKQFTYALLDERAPHTRVLARDEALAELTRRYYNSHGPATIQDFVWWSGLSMADAKAGIAMTAGDLTYEERDGERYWFGSSTPPVAQPSEDAFLLPAYDEFVIGYASFHNSRTAGWDISEPTVFDSMIVIGGKIVGSWRRIFKGKTVVIELAPFAPFNADQDEAVRATARRYGTFVGMPVQCRYVAPSERGSGNRSLISQANDHTIERVDEV